MNIISSFGLSSLLLLTGSVNAQEPALYNVGLYEKSETEAVGFVSLSDSYSFSEHSDSLAVPNLEDKEIEDAYYFILDARYRKNFLSRTNISETDKVFIYDYSTDALVAVSVKSLNIVARLSPYSSEDDWPYSQYDYMIGFEIDRTLLKGFSEYFAHTFVYAGQKNPFVRGQMKPVVWKKAESANIPFGAINAEDASQLGEYVSGDTYTYENENLLYTVRELLRDELIIARWLRVTNIKTKETVRERMYINGESSSGAPLNFVNKEGDETSYQWTGKLFKDKSPVILGFQYHSFGCPEITLIDSAGSDIYIHCDNRH